MAAIATTVLPQTATEARFQFPQSLTCPIMHYLMRDPVIASDGYTYERIAITKCLETTGISPISKQKLDPRALNPNNALRQAITEYLETLAADKQEVIKHVQDAIIANISKVLASLQASPTAAAAPQQDPRKLYAGPEALLFTDGTFTGYRMVAMFGVMPDAMPAIGSDAAPKL